MLIGSGTFVMGKMFGPLLSKPPQDAAPGRRLSTFNVSETEQFLSVHDAGGEEVLQIDYLS